MAHDPRAQDSRYESGTVRYVDTHDDGTAAVHARPADLAIANVINRDSSSQANLWTSLCEYLLERPAPGRHLDRGRSNRVDYFQPNAVLTGTRQCNFSRCLR